MGPFGLETGFGSTLNAGRAGMLLISARARTIGSRVWITFPCEAGAVSVEPETPARVARCSAEGATLFAIGVEFVERAPAEIECLYPDRRRFQRAPLALYLRIVQTKSARTNSASGSSLALWPDEVMTIDLSQSGLLFCSTRVYFLRQGLSITLSDGCWVAGGGNARVVRIAEEDFSSPLLRVGVDFVH